MKAHGAGLEEELGIKMPIQSNSKGGGLSKTRFEGLGDAHRNGLVTSCFAGLRNLWQCEFQAMAVAGFLAKFFSFMPSPGEDGRFRIQATKGLRLQSEWRGRRAE